LNLEHPSGSSKRSSKKHHVPHVNLPLKGLKSLALESSPSVPFTSGNPPSPLQLLDDTRHSQPQPSNRRDSNASSTSLDAAENLPLRWAFDYVSLSSTPGSRLANTHVLFYDTWTDESFGRRRGTLLAVATKSAILLYESPMNERSFRFVKVTFTFCLQNLDQLPVLTGSRNSTCLRLHEL
jgi:hypothetical protein